MARPPPQSFLLRLWREQAEAPLRATLIPVAQPQMPHHFATLEALHDFLRVEADRAATTLRHPRPDEKEVTTQLTDDWPAPD